MMFLPFYLIVSGSILFTVSIICGAIFTARATDIHCVDAYMMCNATTCSTPMCHDVDTDVLVDSQVSFDEDDPCKIHCASWKYKKLAESVSLMVVGGIVSIIWIVCGVSCHCMQDDIRVKPSRHEPYVC
jgi:hypothetical protein